MRHLAALLLALAVAAPARPGQAAPGKAANASERSRIVALRARSDADASVIEVEGDRPLSFTTLKLAGPPRVVVDVADATLDAAARDFLVEDGTVRRVAAAAAGSRTARIVIELAGEAEFDVRAEGNRLDVRVPRLGPQRPPVAVAAAPAVEEAQVPSAPEPTPSVAAEPAPTAPLAANEPAPTEAAPEPTAAAAPEPTVVAAQDQPAPIAKADPIAEAAPAVERKPSRPRSLARVDAPGDASTAAIERPPFAGASSSNEVSRLDASGRASSAAAESLPAAASGSAALERVDATGSASAAAAEAGPQAHSSATAERPVPPPAAAPAATGIEDRPKLPTVSLVGPSGVGQPPPRPTIKLLPPQRKKPPRRVASVRVQKSAIQGIGFRPSAGGVVIIRSDRPVEYTVSSAGRELVVRLPGASIPLPNNRRPIDTSVFGGAVVRVEPRLVPGGVELHVKLRAQAAFQVEQSGAVLTVTFAPAG